MFLDPFGLPLGLASVCGGVLNSSGELVSRMPELKYSALVLKHWLVGLFLRFVEICCRQKLD